MIISNAATGTDLATASPLPSGGNIMTFDVQPVPSGSGVLLPQEIQGDAVVFIRNSGANALLVYPPSGGTIGGSSSPTSMAAAATVAFWSLSGIDWVAKP